MLAQAPMRRIAALSTTMALSLVLAGCGRPATESAADGAQPVTPEEARAIAKDAYIYGFPVVDSYRIMHAYFVNTDNPEYKGPFNRIRHFARVMTPEDKAVQTPNADTPYSFLGMDLRAEPLVLTVPPLGERYMSIQLVDNYTYTFDYIGTRTTGNNGGSYLVAGPGWQGEKPPGVDKVIRSETDLVLAPYRTQLFDAADIGNVEKLQAQYQAQPLSAFLGQPAPAPVPPIDFIAPLTPETQKTSLEFFSILNFVLQFGPTHPSEEALMARFARIGVGAGRTFDATGLSPEIKAAVEAGMADAWAEFAELQKKVDAREITYADIFGTRDYLGGNYLYRMAGAALAIYGHQKEEAVYPVYFVDSDGAALDGANRYRLRFAPDALPPVDAFWSLTMYELPSSLLYANPLDRYLLSSPMLPQFRRDSDGGLTLHVQHESPGKALEANWLPAPDGPFTLALRLYVPKPEALDGRWTEPPVERVR